MYLDLPPEWESLAPTLQSAVRTVLRHQGADADATVSLVLTDDAALRELNRTYRGVDAPTDVLSFESQVRDPQSGRLHLGDVIISVERAAAQAQAAGHETEAEILLLTVHGMLHLLGHDHAAPQEKARMWQAQREILAALGLEHVQVTE